MRLLACFVLSCAAIAAPEDPGLVVHQIVIVADDTSPMVATAAGILQQRLERRGLKNIAPTAEMPENAELTIVLGRVDQPGIAAELARERGVSLPGAKGPLPESYAVKTVSLGGKAGILAIAADTRGLLYAVGEIVRRSIQREGALEFRAIDVSSAPAFRFRGFSPNQGGTMRKITGARAWTFDEVTDCVLDYTLAGANCFYAEDQGGPLFDFLKSWELMTVTGARPNQLRSDFPPEWKAGGREGWEGNNWVCPNIPEARKALMDQWTEDFSKRAQHDIMRFYAGDPGGCTDERCTPWGKTFVHLCEEMANVWHQTHPNSIVLVANQGLDNAGDQAILDYFNAEKRDWCYGLCYGPGSNALSNYFREELREDLFVYPGQGPVNRYLAELYRQLPNDKQIVHYSDITHWISAQFMVEHPDRTIMKAYGRRTFHARPKAMYTIFQRIMPFSEGDIIYSEGHHDEFHQYIWSRLLWNPNQTVEDVTLEYCRLHFGEEAADLMMQALFQLEENLERPVDSNEGIERYYDLVAQAGKVMPTYIMEGNYRWRLHMQKACMDKYIQAKLRDELAREQRVREALTRGVESDKLKPAIEEALEILEAPAESPEMTALRDEAGRLGQETDALFGVRDVGFFRADRSLRGLDGTKNVLVKAQEEGKKKERRRLVDLAIQRTSEPTEPGNIFW